jgi:hypothetical protein
MRHLRGFMSISPRSTLSHRTLTITACLLVLAGCEVVHGSGNVITEKRSIDEFEVVQLEGEGTIEFVQADQERLVIEAEDNIVDELVTVVRGDTLVLKTRDRVVLDPTRPIVFQVAGPTLRSIRVEGTGEFETERLETDHLEIDISGSASLKIDDLQARTVSAGISGAGDVHLSGTVQAQDVDISGAGEYRCRELKSEDARIDVSGSGEVEVFVTESLEVEISGSGDVGVRGNPDTSVEISGSGDLNAID